MPKRIQDIKVIDRRGIRDVPLSARSLVKETIKSKKTDIDEEVEEETENDKEDDKREEKSSKTRKESKNDIEEVPITRVETPARRMPVTPPSTPHRKTKRKFGKWPLITLGVIVLIMIIGYFASTYYSQATFTIIPKVIPVSVNSTYVAQGTPQNSGLFYEVITVKSQATTTVVGTNGPQINTKATGKAILYNTYSDQAVRLIAGTRLSGPDGFIYRLTSSVVIPRYTKPASVVVPGKISVTIIADQAGQNYNLPKTDQPIDLSIVAYKGSPKYDTIYAQTSGAISGGFAGMKKTVNPTVLASTTASLKSQITSAMTKQVTSSIPDGYIMFDKGYVAVFGAPIIGGNASSTNISLSGTLYGIIVPKNRLIEAFAGDQTISLFKSFSYTAPGLESVDSVITNLKDFSPTKKGALVIHAKGDMKIIGTIPVEEIKKKLAGLPLAKTQDIFKLYSPVIESGSGELAPPWAKIPTDLKRLKVIVKEP